MDLHLLVLHPLLGQNGGVRVAISHAVPGPLVVLLILHALLDVLHDRVRHATVRQWVQALADGVRSAVRPTAELDVRLDRDPSEAVRLHAQELTLLEEFRIDLIVPRRQHHLWQYAFVQVSHGGEAAAGGRPFADRGQIDGHIETVPRRRCLQELVLFRDELLPRLQIEPAEVGLDLDVLGDRRYARPMRHVGRMLLASVVLPVLDRRCDRHEFAAVMGHLERRLLVHLLVAIVLRAAAEEHGTVSICVSVFDNWRGLLIYDRVGGDHVQGAGQRARLQFAEVIILRRSRVLAAPFG